MAQMQLVTLRAATIGRRDELTVRAPAKAPHGVTFDGDRALRLSAGRGKGPGLVCAGALIGDDRERARVVRERERRTASEAARCMRDARETFSRMEVGERPVGHGPKVRNSWGGCSRRMLAKHHLIRSVDLPATAFAKEVEARIELADRRVAPGVAPRLLPVHECGSTPFLHMDTRRFTLFDLEPDVGDTKVPHALHEECVGVDAGRAILALRQLR